MRRLLRNRRRLRCGRLKDGWVLTDLLVRVGIVAGEEIIRHRRSSSGCFSCLANCQIVLL